jgi:hypothetical protein
VAPIGINTGEAVVSLKGVAAPVVVFQIGGIGGEYQLYLPPP